MLRIALITVGLLLIEASHARAFDITPEVGARVMVTNFCYDTPILLQEVNALNAEQGGDVAESRHSTIMSTSRLTRCHSNILWPVEFIEKTSETPDLRTSYGRCFIAQVWKVEPVLGPPSKRKMYSTWHIAWDVEV